MEWREIKDTEGRYLISDTGLVYSVFSKREIKQFIGNTGYYRVELNVNGKATKKFVHRLVAETFLDNPNNYPIVNHKDENPLNNNVDNLEWCTQKYNVNYGTCREKARKNHVYKSGKENAKSITIYQYDKDGNFIAEYGSAYEAERMTGLRAKSISKARSGALKTYAGYTWREQKV